jgi:site-specific recombinase XerD
MEYEMFDFMRHIRPRIAAGTWHRKQWQLQSFLKYLAGKYMNPANVTRRDVETFLSGLHCSQPFRQSVCGVVREYYDFMQLRYPHLCPEENPATGIAFKPDKGEHLPNVPSQAAVDEIFEHLPDTDDELRMRDRLMAELAYGSGLRRAELHRLNIEDIDREENTVRVLGKGNKVRVVPLTEQALDATRKYLLRRRASRGPLLVSYAGRRLSCNGVYSVMRNRIGMRPHLFRHAFATHLLKNGCSIRVIQELLGHNRLSTTYLYTSVEKNGLKRVVQAAHPRAKN